MTILSALPALRGISVSLATGALLAACGGGSSSTTAPPVVSNPQVTPPPGIVLLAENPSGYYFPGGVAVDQAGTVYIGNNALHEIAKVAQDGTVSSIAGNRSVPVWTDGTGDKAGFDFVDQLVFDKRSPGIYVVDRHYQESAGVLRRVKLTGEVQTVALSPLPTHEPSGGPLGTTGTQAAVLAFGADNTLYAATMRSAVPLSSGGGPHITYTGYRYLNWRTVEDDGKGRSLYQQEIYYSAAGTQPDESKPNYQYPTDASATGGIVGFNVLGLALDRAGNAYLADTDRSVIIKVTPAGVASIYAGKVKTEGSADGAVTAALFKGPTQLAIDKSDNLFVLDRGNATVRKITPAGNVTTVVGVAGQAKTATGALPGGLGNPAGLTLDDSGRLYITVDKGLLRVQLP